MFLWSTAVLSFTSRVRHLRYYSSQTQPPLAWYLHPAPMTVVSYNQGDRNLVVRARLWVTLHRPINLHLIHKESSPLQCLDQFVSVPMTRQFMDKISYIDVRTRFARFTTTGGALVTISAKTTAFPLAGKPGGILNFTTLDADHHPRRRRRSPRV